MDLAPFSALDDVWISEFANANVQPISASSWNPVQGFKSRDNFKLASTSAPIEGESSVPGLASPTQGRKRNASVAGFDSSPASASVESPDINGDELGRDGRRRPVKRACNECRQQKVSDKIGRPRITAACRPWLFLSFGDSCVERRSTLEVALHMSPGTATC